MRFIEGKLKDLWVIEPDVHEDSRGFFMETWSKKEFEEHGLNYDFVQDNHSSSHVKGTLRGIHFQRGDYSQAKLVRCIKGKVFDVAIDLRPSSSTYLQWEGFELSDQKKKEVLIPRGFGHGFLTLTDESEFLYRADNPYYPESEGGILWNDPELGIAWPLSTPIILSDRDSKNPCFKETITGFESW